MPQRRSLLPERALHEIVRFRQSSETDRTLSHMTNETARTVYVQVHYMHTYTYERTCNNCRKIVQYFMYFSQCLVVSTCSESYELKRRYTEAGFSVQHISKLYNLFEKRDGGFQIMVA